MANLDIYNRLITLLNERGITTYRLAKDTGLNPSMFSHWKNDKYFPKKDKLEAIANYLNISLSYLMGVTDIPNEELTLEEAEKRLDEIQQKAEYNRKLAEQYSKEAEELEKRLERFNHMLDIMNKIESLTPEQRNAIELILNQFNNK